MVTVSIVTYKTDLHELARCVQSLTSPLISTIYIIDNSRQHDIETFCKGYSNIVYVGSENVGYGAGHNQALRRVLNSEGVKYHLVLNSDVYFEPEAIGRLVAYMDANANVAQVQPNIVYPNGAQQYTCRLLPTPTNLLFRRFLPKKLVATMNNRYQLKFADHSREFNVPYQQGSFMFFRVECFRTVGLFDERFFMYPEDIDITRRMHRLYRTMFWPGVTVVHNHRAASYQNRTMLKIHMKNMVKYFNKWGWLFDRERRQWNTQLLRELGYHK
jgi:hypothetical protein